MTDNAGSVRLLGRAALRGAAATFLGLLIFILLWWTVFTATTAAIVAVGIGALVVALSMFSDAASWVLEMIAAALAAMIAAIGAIFSILSN